MKNHRMVSAVRTTTIIDVLAGAAGVAYVAAVAEAQADVREQAVFANAEGWQSRPITVETWNDPMIHTVTVRAKMMMEREEPDGD